MELKYPSLPFRWCRRCSMFIVMRTGPDKMEPTCIVFVVRDEETRDVGLGVVVVNVPRRRQVKLCFLRG